MLGSRSLLVICFVYIVVCLCLSRSVGPTQCNPMDYSLPGSSVHEILQARILEWVAIPFVRRSQTPNISLPPLFPFNHQFNCSVMFDSLRPHGMQYAGFPVDHRLPELAQTDIHQVGDAIQPSHPLNHISILKSKQASKQRKGYGPWVGKSILVTQVDPI